VESAVTLGAKLDSPRKSSRPVVFEAKSSSSTIIRRNRRKGRFFSRRGASLGRPFCLTGEVVSGSTGRVAVFHFSYAKPSLPNKTCFPLAASYNITALAPRRERASQPLGPKYRRTPHL